MVTVQQMYNYCKDNNIKLLSTYGGDYWSAYLLDNEKFDTVFRALYKSFWFYDQDDCETVEDVTTRFITVIEAWLSTNAKNYGELYRINVVDDTKYSVLDNYDITETYSGTDNNQSGMTYGQRTDIDNFTKGNEKTDSLNKVTAFNSNAEQSDTSNSIGVGTRNDIDQFTKGEQTDIGNVNSQQQHTMNKKGNIGVSTQSDVMKKHVDFWNVYNFYIKIFDDINRYFLRGV